MARLSPGNRATQAVGFARASSPRPLSYSRRREPKGMPRNTRGEGLRERAGGGRPLEREVEQDTRIRGKEKGICPPWPFGFGAAFLAVLPMAEAAQGARRSG